MEEVDGSMPAPSGAPGQPPPRFRILWRYAIGEGASCLGISVDGNYIVVGSNDRHVYFFDREKGLQWDHSASTPILSVALTNKGNYVVVGTHNDISLLDKTGKLLWNKPVGKKVRCVGISSVGDYIIAGTDTKYIYVFDRNGTELKKHRTLDPASFMMSRNLTSTLPFAVKPRYTF